MQISEIKPNFNYQSPAINLSIAKYGQCRCTTTEEAGTIREGHFIVINNRAYEVSEVINTPKRWRHEATVGFVAYDIFNRTMHDVPLLHLLPITMFL
nr:eukaryotic translation initiation factor 5A [Tanacetum cinerariifolium]